MSNPTNMPIRVLIVDDHEMVRDGLSMLLSVFDDLQLVGQATDGSEVVERCGDVQPDVILMDMKMPRMDGIAATRAVKAAYPQVQVIALTSAEDSTLVPAALEAGAIAFLGKNVSIKELAGAIRAAYAGKHTLAPEAVQALLENTRRPAASNEYHLTEREREILNHLIKGLSNTEIAARLTISPATVKYHVSGVLAKLGVASRTEAVAMALQHGLTT